MKRLLLVVFAATALSMAACSNNDNGNDGGTTTDAGATDAGAKDAGTNDAGTNDAGVTDGGTDAGTNDGGTSDGGTDGGVPQGTATISGTIPGSTNFTPVDAITTVDTNNANIVITEINNSCSLAQGSTIPKNAQLLTLDLHNQVSGQDAALTTGTYNITTDNTPPDGLSAQATFTTTDQICAPTEAAVATGGTVTITTLNTTNTGAADGSFSLQFPNAGTTTTTVTGTFTAPVCDTSGAPTTPTCQ